MKKSLLKHISIIQIIIFLSGMILPQASLAQGVFSLTPPNAIVSLSPAFSPVILRGIKVNPDKPFQFDFILDPGTSRAKGDDLKQEAVKALKYFLSTLTVPQEDLWVNLSPNEKDRIIPGEFGKTEMGRDLLAQDYLLKQLTSSLMYPEGETGKRFWAKIYKRVYDQYGSVDIDTTVLNRVWIVPEYAEVYQMHNRAIVTRSKLKVMLEEEYLKGMSPRVQASSPNKEVVATRIVKEIIIPELEREVNEGANFAPLRQIYHSMILATWFKENVKESLINKAYVDQNKITGIDLKDKAVKEKIYRQYMKAFEGGIYNMIKEEYDPVTRSLVPKKYFSGGFTGQGINKAMVTKSVPSFSSIKKILAVVAVSALLNISVVFNPAQAQTVDLKKSEGKNITADSKEQNVPAVTFDAVRSKKEENEDVAVQEKEKNERARKNLNIDDAFYKTFQKKMENLQDAHMRGFVFHAEDLKDVEFRSFHKGKGYYGRAELAFYFPDNTKAGTIRIFYYPKTQTYEYSFWRERVSTPLSKNNPLRGKRFDAEDIKGQLDYYYLTPDKKKELYEEFLKEVSETYELDKDDLKENHIRLDENKELRPVKVKVDGVAVGQIVFSYDRAYRKKLEVDTNVNFLETVMTAGLNLTLLDRSPYFDVNSIRGKSFDWKLIGGITAVDNLDLQFMFDNKAAAKGKPGDLKEFYKQGAWGYVPNFKNQNRRYLYSRVDAVDIPKAISGFVMYTKEQKEEMRRKIDVVSDPLEKELFENIYDNFLIYHSTLFGGKSEDKPDGNFVPEDIDGKGVMFDSTNRVVFLDVPNAMRNAAKKSVYVSGANIKTPGAVKHQEKITRTQKRRIDIIWCDDASGSQDENERIAQSQQKKQFFNFITQKNIDARFATMGVSNENPEEVEADKSIKDMLAEIESEAKVSEGEGATYIVESLLAAVKSLGDQDGGIVYLTTGDNIPDPYADKNVDQSDPAYRENLKKRFEEEIIPALEEASLKTDGVEIVIVLQDSQEDSYFTGLIKEYRKSYEKQGLRPRIHLKYSAQDETALSMFNFLEEAVDFSNVISLSDPKNYEGVYVNIMDAKGDPVVSYDLEGNKMDAPEKVREEDQEKIYDGYIYKKDGEFILPKSGEKVISRDIKFKTKDVPVSLHAGDADAEVVYQIDVSGSMYGHFDEVKRILTALIKKTNVRGIMFFSSASSWVTGSKEEMIKQVEEIKTGGFTNGDKATEETIDHIVNDLKRSVDSDGNKIKLKYVNVSDLLYNGAPKNYVDFYKKLSEKNIELEYVVMGSAYQDIINTVKTEILSPLEVFKRKGMPASVKNLYLGAAVNGSNGYQNFPVHLPGENMRSLYESFIVYCNSLLRGGARYPDYYDLINEVTVTENLSGEFDWGDEVGMSRGSLYRFEQRKYYITGLLNAGYIEKVQGEDGRYIGRFTEKFKNVVSQGIGFSKLKGLNDFEKQSLFDALKKLYDNHRKVDKTYQVVDAYGIVGTLRNEAAQHRELGYKIKGISWSGTSRYIMPISGISDEELSGFIVKLVEQGYKKIELHSAVPGPKEFTRFPGKQDFVSEIDFFESEAEQVARVDKAMVSKNKVGGIDFNPDRMSLNVRGQDIVFPQGMNARDFAPQNLEGLTPYIFHITPIADVGGLIGFFDGKDEEGLPEEKSPAA